MKFTDEQLSRILGEHDCSQLADNTAYRVNWGLDRYGSDIPHGCALQVADNISGPPLCEAGFKFDREFRYQMASEELLKFLTKL